MSVPFPIAVPTPRFVFTRLGCEHLYHLTGFAALENGIVRRLTGRRGEWADCDVTLLAASGFDPSLRKLFRDYSIVDVELGMKDRGRYTYFFAGAPTSWGIFKNIDPNLWDLFSIGRGKKSLEDRGLATVRIRTDDLLARYDGPLFYRPDDHALVIRGGYEGPAQVKPLPSNFQASFGDV